MVLTALTIVAAVPSLGRTPDRWLEWDAACHERGVIPERRPSDEASGRLIAMVGVGGKQTRVAMRRGLARLKADMVARKVLCDDKHVGIPCNVSVVGADVISACVPEGAPALSASLCDPWGLDFQQEAHVLDQTRRPLHAFDIIRWRT